MEKKGNSGCRVVAMIFAGIVVLFLVVVFGLYWMFTARKSEAVEAVQIAEAEVMAETAPAVLELESSDWESLEPLAEGEPVTLRHYILLMEDPRATELARTTFLERAEGAPVTWTMTLEDVWEESGVLGASLRADYSMQSGSVIRGSSISVRADFDESQRDALIGLRQGDVVTVEGVLALDGERVVIEHAGVATNAGLSK